jgi:hypothetical protein
VFSLFALLGVAALRLRLRNRCGLGLNQNPPFLDGHELVFEFHRIGDKIGQYPDVSISGADSFFDRSLPTACWRMEHILR